MSYNGSGTFNINSTGQPVVAGTVITASAFNALTTDLATGLTTAITKDGQTTTTARITFAQGLTSSLVTDSSSVSTGSIITAGGAGIAKNLYVGGIASFSAQPIFTSLTASSAVATDASKGLVSVTNTGTGNNVLATSPTLVTPALGTPASGVMTNVTAIPAAQITGSQAIPKSTLPTGSVLQVVEGLTQSETFTNSTSYVATNLTASITPTSATSKVLIILSSTIYASNIVSACAATIYRDGSDIASAYSVGALFFGEGAVSWVKCATTILDSPASTSSLTYVLRIKTINATYSAGANRNNSRNSIILMEIAA
jgi:hypothetical protein